MQRETVRHLMADETDFVLLSDEVVPAAAGNGWVESFDEAGVRWLSPESPAQPPARPACDAAAPGTRSESPEPGREDQ